MIETLPGGIVVDHDARTVDVAGGCLSALCLRDAVYEVQMPGDWWWPECAEHTATLRAALPDYVQAVRLYTRGPDNAEAPPSGP